MVSHGVTNVQVTSKEQYTNLSPVQQQEVKQAFGVNERSLVGWAPSLKTNASGMGANAVLFGAKATQEPKPLRKTIDQWVKEPLDPTKRDLTHWQQSHEFDQEFAADVDQRADTMSNPDQPDQPANTQAQGQANQLVPKPDNKPEEYNMNFQKGHPGRNKMVPNAKMRFSR